MKKVFIASHCMEIGGAERALIGLLNSFNYSEYQVDLLLYRQQGELLAYIPKEVNLLPENDMNCLAIPMKQLVKEKKYKMLYGRLKAKVKAHSYVKKHNYKDNQVELTYSHLYTYPYVQEIHGKYDLAISFLTPHYYVAKKVDAAKKIAWIHTDYSTIEVDEAVEMNMWNAFDYIASISEQCSQAFLKKLPGLKEKLIRIDNIILSDFIIRQADEFPVKEFDGEVNLLSVGRYSYAKNFDNVPEICSYLIENIGNVKWYIIGYGGEEQLIKDKIKEFHMEEHVILLGKKENPYPYIKECDWYIQPSRYEGKAITVREAQILHKPVIISAFPTSKSQLEDGIDGLIVPLENRECAEAITKAIQSESLKRQLIQKVSEIEYSNSFEIDKLYRIMEE